MHLHGIPSAGQGRDRKRCKPGSRRGWGFRLLQRPRRLISVILVVLFLAILMMPVPWRHIVSDDPIGSAWRLDGRLQVDGVTVDPPGTWMWLAVGRPELVGEVIYRKLFGSDNPPADLRSGALSRRPALNEPAAAAVGLRHAGRDIPVRLLVEVRDPVLDGYPYSAQIESVNGIALTDRQAWERASSGWQAAAGLSTSETGNTLTASEQVTFRLRDGRQLTAQGPGLPYATVHTLDLAPEDLHAGITFKVARLLPVDWFRNLSLGRSHGMMIALITYAHASGRDLAQGRHIAGTGGIRGDGTVIPVGGVPAKAKAANRSGADVLLVPASQAHLLDEVTLPGTAMVPIESLDDAIQWLGTPRS